jgi:hypothetical protein
VTKTRLRFLLQSTAKIKQMNGIRRTIFNYRRFPLTDMLQTHRRRSSYRLTREYHSCRNPNPRPTPLILRNSEVAPSVHFAHFLCFE